MPSITEAEIHPATAGHEFRADLLLDATVQFCISQPKQRNNGSDQFKKLFYSLIGYTNNLVKKLISCRLACNQNTPRSIAYYLAMEKIDIAAPMLLISPVFWETDLIRLVKKLDLPYLSIIARRSDVTMRVAQVLIEHGDDNTRRILLANPAAKLNAIRNTGANIGVNLDGKQQSTSYQPPTDNETFATEIKVEIKVENKAEDRQTLVQQLLKLANVNEKGIRPVQENKTINNQDTRPEKSIGTRLLSHAKAKDYRQVIKVISQQIGMDIEKVEKIVLHENPSSLAIFLKGLGVSAPEASVLLVELNKSVARNIAELASCMEQFNRFSIPQCCDIMRNLGAKLPKIEGDDTSRDYNNTVLSNAVSARRRQIFATPAPVLFGSKSKTG